MTDFKKGYYSRPATDVYSRKQIDKQVDRLQRLHDLNRDKIRDLKVQVQAIESLINSHVTLVNAIGKKEEEK